jgi:hypothetical protein
MNQEPQGAVGSHSQGDTLADALACLSSAFISANGVNPSFYREAGGALVKHGHVSLNTETKRISRNSENRIWQFLIDRSFPRGEYVARLVAKRICLAIDQINDAGGDEFVRQLVKSDKESAKMLLMPLYGMGPKSFQIYWSLANESSA